MPRGPFAKGFAMKKYISGAIAGFLLCCALVAIVEYSPAQIALAEPVAIAAQDENEDFTDSGVGCVDDCTAPATN